ncbi:uncharacterized protein [Diadema setosum]|uniref:uncharacterized protein n=1 Tax=Diadema setosum TaxID=31175 RepID=UPI003B3A017A
MDRQQYIDEAMKHLHNPSHYTLLDFDPTDEFSQQFQSTLDDMKEHDHLTKKIHKLGNPGRPILSGNGSPTENISLFVDHHIKPLVSFAPSYIHDTPDFLRKLYHIKDQIFIPYTAIISTFNASFLYIIFPMMKLQRILATFMDKHYIQVSGTATLCMGTRMAPSFACLFMTKLEQQMLDSASCPPWLWWRYIDDNFFIWTREEESLYTFIDSINSFHRTIKFTSDFFQEETNFLDVTVRKESNHVTTTLYTKPTDTHQYLHSANCHPHHCKTSIPYSQALRLRRICSEDSEFSFHARNLKRHLTARGYGTRRVQQAINKDMSTATISNVHSPVQFVVGFSKAEIDKTNLHGWKICNNFLQLLQAFKDFLLSVLTETVKS